MKKCLFVVIAVVAVALCGLGFYFDNQGVGYDAVVMANVEALSVGESGSSMACSNSLTYTGSYNHMTMSCKTCSFRVGYTGTNDSVSVSNIFNYIVV